MTNQPTLFSSGPYGGSEPAKLAAAADPPSSKESAERHVRSGKVCSGEKWPRVTLRSDSRRRATAKPTGTVSIAVRASTESGRRHNRYHCRPDGNASR